MIGDGKLCDSLPGYTVIRCRGLQQNNFIIRSVEEGYGATHPEKSPQNSPENRFFLLLKKRFTIFAVGAI